MYVCQNVKGLYQVREIIGVSCITRHLFTRVSVVLVSSDGQRVDMTFPLSMMVLKPTLYIYLSTDGRAGHDST